MAFFLLNFLFFGRMSLNNIKYLIVVYKEDEKKNDGFIITAFTTYKINKNKKRKILWSKK